MNKFVVLGASGMLGQQVSRLAREKDLVVVDVSRNGENSFTYEGSNLPDLERHLDLGPGDTLVNCIGWIPQKKSGSTEMDTKLAYLLNSELVEDLRDWRTRAGFNWVQILTDCVFSGSEGSYNEFHTKDATDLYGLSKINGEGFLDGAIAIRSSIVGADRNSKSGLYSWFKFQLAEGAKVRGYSNSLWNGVSTMAFARLALGVHSKKAFGPGIYHWIPKDKVSKYGLLTIFSDFLGTDSSLIEKWDLPATVDRTLATLHPSLNKQLWEIAGYETVPSIEDLCREFILSDRSTE
jgi:dTDP-4-dehydrorhamnose reductase